MNEPPGARMRVAMTGLTLAEYFRDVQKQDVLLFIDNIFRYIQAVQRGFGVAGPYAVGRRLPAHAGHRGGRASGAHRLHVQRFDYLGAGDLRARGRPDRPGASRDLLAPGRNHGAFAPGVRDGHLPRRSARSTPRRASSSPRSSGETHYAVAARVAAGAPALPRAPGHHRDPGQWTNCPRRTG